MHEINKNIVISKQLHQKRQAICCGLNFFNKRSNPIDKSKVEMTDEKEKSRLYNDYVDLFERMKNDFNISLPDNSYKNIEYESNEVEIDLMGDYRYAMNQKNDLRNPYIFDEEIP